MGMSLQQVFDYNQILTNVSRADLVMLSSVGVSIDAMMFEALQGHAGCPIVLVNEVFVNQIDYGIIEATYDSIIDNDNAFLSDYQVLVDKFLDIVYKLYLNIANEFRFTLCQFPEWHQGELYIVDFMALSCMDSYTVNMILEN